MNYVDNDSVQLQNNASNIAIQAAILIWYTWIGDEGKGCADCKHFERDVNMQGIGKCFSKGVTPKKSAL